MRILITVGHSILKNGGTTSAVGYIHEYNYNKKLATYVKNEIEKCGHSVDIVVCPEKRFTSWTQERKYKLPIANNGKYDLVAELHLNASNGSGNGSEVLCYGDNRGKLIADRACQYFGKLGFKNRGVKIRKDLYMIAQTNPVALIFESFFCDNKHDCDLANELGYEKIAKAICYGLVGEVRDSNSKSETKVNKPHIVIYKGDEDIHCANILAHHFKCEKIRDDGTINTSKYGGKDKYNIIYIGEGKNRAESAKIALNKYIK